MILSPFTPLFFLDSRKADGIDSEYIQTFATTDQILVQLICDRFDNVGTLKVLDPDSGQVLFELPYNTWQMNANQFVAFKVLRFSPGVYSVAVNGNGLSKPFIVTDDERELSRTTLIQYSMRDNRRRQDTVFFIDGMQYFFDFRVPGGFKDSGWSFSVESEQFETPVGDISQLYGLETTQKTFTLGGSMGVPIWFGEMLNRLLVCSHVYFDGVRYSRKESSVPEVMQQLEGHNSFVFTQTLQRSNNLDPRLEERNHVILRRINDGRYRLVNPSNNIYRKI